MWRWLWWLLKSLLNYLLSIHVQHLRESSTISVQKIDELAKFFGSGLLYRPCFFRHNCSEKSHEAKTLWSLDCGTEPLFPDTKWNSENLCTVPFKVAIPVQKIQKIREAKFFGSGLLYRPSFARYTIVQEIHEAKFFGLDCCTDPEPYNYLFRKFHEEKFFGLDCCTDPTFPGTIELRKIHEAKFFDLDAA